MSRFIEVNSGGTPILINTEYICRVYIGGRIEIVVDGVTETMYADESYAQIQELLIP